MVVIEDLHVCGMMQNGKLARAIADVGMGEFRRQMADKCAWYGSQLVKADRWFPSSKRCSRCAQVKESLALSERIYHCAVCGLTMGRDRNAALNLQPLTTTASSAGGGGKAVTQACGEVALSALRSRK